MGLVSAGHAGARRENAQRGLVVWEAGRTDSREVSEAASRTSALHLFPCLLASSSRRSPTRYSCGSGQSTAMCTRTTTPLPAPATMCGTAIVFTIGAPYWVTSNIWKRTAGRSEARSCAVGSVPGHSVFCWPHSGFTASFPDPSGKGPRRSACAWHSATRGRVQPAVLAQTSAWGSLASPLALFASPGAARLIASLSSLHRPGTRLHNAMTALLLPVALLSIFPSTSSLRNSVHDRVTLQLKEPGPTEANIRRLG
jgi:hypothetical protein